MILPDSLQLRRSAIAYLYANAVPLDKKENLAFYDEVSTHGLDYPELQQLPQELVLLRRTSADQVAEIRVGHMVVQGAAPIPGPVPPALFRFLVAESGSTRPLRFFRDSAETAYGSFERMWGSRVGQLQMVEVSFHATLAVNDAGGAPSFLAQRMLRIEPRADTQLGRHFEHLALRMGSGLTLVRNVGESGPISSGQIDVALESPQGDTRLLVITLNVKWPLIRLPLAGLSPEILAATGGRDFVELNTVTRPSNEYLDDAYKYLERNLIPFLEALGR